MTRDGSRDNDLILTLMILLVGVFLAGSLSAVFSDVQRLLAWVHVVPFAALDRMLARAGDVPLFGSWLLVPAGLVEPVLRPMAGRDGSSIPWSVSQVVAGRCATGLYCLPCCVLMWLAGWPRPDLKFRTRHTLDSLMAELASVWPTGALARHRPATTTCAPPVEAPRATAHPSLGALLVPLGAVDPRAADADALWPEHWLVSQGLARPTNGAGGNGESAGQFTDSNWRGLTEDAVTEVLATQLSEPWQGIGALPSSEQALVAALACCHGFRLEEGRAILVALARHADRYHDTLDRFDAHLTGHRTFMARIDAVLHSGDGQALVALAEDHAWKLTALLALFHQARDGRGVIAPCEFLWLKHTNRMLWYVLNTAGNTVAVAETAGINAHYLAERQMGCALHSPAVRQVARVLLDDYLDQSGASVARRKRRFLIRQSPRDRILAGRAMPPSSLSPGLARRYGGQSCGL